MNCKFCGAEMEEAMTVCPECGKAQDEQEVRQEPICADGIEADEESEVLQATAEEQSAQSAETVEAAEEAAEQTAAKQAKKKTTILIAAVCILAALVIALAALLLVPKITAYIEQQKQQQAAQETEERLANLPSFYAEQEALSADVLDTVVATCGEDQITNRDFPFYYWEQYRFFLNSYGQYVSYIMDTTQGLDKQMYDEEQTWQQVFMSGAATMFHSVSACTQEAEKNGFELSDQSRQSLANMAEGLEQTAQSYGYAGADDYLAVNYGEGCTVEGYIEFVRKMRVAREYLSHLVDEKGYTEEDISAYFDKNAEQYTQSGIEKVDKPNVTVRHILIQPEEKDDDGNYTDAAWKAAEEKINEVLAEFEAGARNEERFSELAELYSNDGGSATNGGLYADVYPGQMVESFNDWCFADGRKEGDYGIVKSDFGYHLIYFVSQSEEIYWYETAKEDYRNELSTQIEEELTAQYQTTFDESKVRLVDVTKQETNAAN